MSKRPNLSVRLFSGKGKTKTLVKEDLVASKPEVSNFIGDADGTWCCTNEDTGEIIFEGKTPIKQMDTLFRHTYEWSLYFNFEWAQNFQTFLQLQNWLEETNQEHFQTLDQYEQWLQPLLEPTFFVRGTAPIKHPCSFGEARSILTPTGSKYWTSYAGPYDRLIFDNWCSRRHFSRNHFALLEPSTTKKKISLTYETSSWIYKIVYRISRLGVVEDFQTQCTSTLSTRNSPSVSKEQILDNKNWLIRIMSEAATKIFKEQRPHIYRLIKERIENPFVFEKRTNL